LGDKGLTTESEAAGRRGLRAEAEPERTDEPAKPACFVALNW